ncbi:hypothetical protein JCM10207_006281, partial [Rhodosporidiobolus poonsookiae]
VLLLLQDPPRTLPPLPPAWRILSPPAPPQPREGEKPTLIRSLALVTSRIPPSAVEQYAVDSFDTVAFDLRGEGESVRVVGLYNPHSGNSAHNAPLCLLPTLLACEPRTDRVVVAADLNLRHQKWEPAHTEAPLPGAEEAAALFDDLALHLLLPLDTITWHGHNGRNDGVLDLVLGDLRTAEDFVSCGLVEDLECSSDHRPIRLVLPASLPPPATPPPRWAFRKADPETVVAAAELFSRLIPPRPLNTAADIDEEAERLTLGLSYARLTLGVSYARLAAIPLSRAPRRQHAHAWWGPELAEASDAVRAAQDRACMLRKRAARTGREEVAEEAEAARKKARSARNRVVALVRREKRRVEREEAHGATLQSIWPLARRAQGLDGTLPLRPPLAKGDGTYATTPADKLALLLPVLQPVVEPAATVAGGEGANANIDREDDEDDGGEDEGDAVGARASE